MRYPCGLWILLGALFWTPPAASAKPDAHEFTVPLQVAATEPRTAQRAAGRVRTIRDVLTGEPALQAKDAQDAIAAAVGQHAAGCRMIRFATGFGWVATGMADYPDSENPATLRRSAQEARPKAFTDARMRLAGCVAALSPEARQEVAKALEQDDATRLALVNLAANDAEKQEQALRILARGFVAYSTEDDPARHAIYAHLVTTPKTAHRLTRPTANAIEATSLQEGLRQVSTEIGAGLIPPVGNRLIVVNATGELALVGYAIAPFDTPSAQADRDRLRADAGNIATIRATEALAGLATGDDAAWKNGLDETLQREIQVAGGGYDDSEASAHRFGQIRDLVMTSVKDDAGLQALREGRLPAAVMVKRFSGEDAIAIALIHTPSIRKHDSKPAAAPTPPSAPATGILPSDAPANESARALPTMGGDPEPADTR